MKIIQNAIALMGAGILAVSITGIVCLALGIPYSDDARFIVGALGMVAFTLVICRASI